MIQQAHRPPLRPVMETYTAMLATSDNGTTMIGSGYLGSGLTFNAQTICLQSDLSARSRGGPSGANGLASSDFIGVWLLAPSQSCPLT